MSSDKRKKKTSDAGLKPAGLLPEGKVEVISPDDQKEKKKGKDGEPPSGGHTPKPKRKSRAKSKSKSQIN